MRHHKPYDYPIGPHPCPMWESDFSDLKYKDKWWEVVNWLETNHGDQIILIHPHSINGGYIDHTEYAYWVGDPL